MRGYIMVLLATLMLSTTGILIRFLLDDYHVPTLALAFLRVAIVALALGLGLALARPRLLRVELRHLLPFALLGLIGVGLHQVVWITSVQMNGVGIATVLVYIQPAIVALVAWRFMGEALNWPKMAALLLAMAGIVMVSQAYSVLAAGSAGLNTVGLLAGVGTGFTWATYALLGRSTAQKYSPWTSLFYAFFFGVLFLLPLQWLAGGLFASANLGQPQGIAPNMIGSTFALSADGWAVLLLLALGPTLGGFGLYTFGLAHLPASVATLLGTLEPVFSIVFAYILFAERLDGVQVAGAALILWSVVMLRPQAVRAGRLDADG
jgi:drug/metabolite transporter, DME family